MKSSAALVKLGSYLVGTARKAVSGFGTLLGLAIRAIVACCRLATNGDSGGIGASVVKAALTGNLSEVKRLYDLFSDEHAAAMRRAIGMTTKRPG